MEIFFGKKRPSLDEVNLLVKLGFSVDNIKDTGDGYSLEIPADAHFTMLAHPQTFYGQFISVYYNDIQVIIMNRCITPVKSYTFYISESAVKSAVKSALKKDDQMTENHAFSLF